MGPVRYFYSTDGTNVHGPVTREALRLLLQNQTIDSSSFFCIEGKSEWLPVNPADFQMPAAVARFKPIEPPPYVPTAQALERRKQPLPTWELPDYPLLILKWGSAALGVGISIALVVIRAGQSNQEETLPYYFGGVVGGFLFIWGVPTLISMVFKDLTRYIIRTIGIAILGFLTIVGQLNSPAAHLQAADLKTSKS